MIDTPELDKQLKIIESGATTTLTDFYDWLTARGYHICEYVQYTDDDGDDEGEPKLVPTHIQPEQLFANFFGIDRDKIEAERRAIIKELRGES
jgi:hypothetical protein